MSGNLTGTITHPIANNTKLSVVGESSSSFKSAQNIIEVSSKASGQDAEFKAGRITRTISVSSIASSDPTLTSYGFDTAIYAQAGLLPIAFSLTEYSSGTAVVGSTIIAGSAYVSNVSWENPDNDKMTFSLDLQVSGSVTVGINS